MWICKAIQDRPTSMEATLKMQDPPKIRTCYPPTPFQMPNPLILSQLNWVWPTWHYLYHHDDITVQISTGLGLQHRGNSTMVQSCSCHYDSVMPVFYYNPMLWRINLKLRELNSKISLATRDSIVVDKHHSHVILMAI